MNPINPNVHACAIFLHRKIISYKARTEQTGEDTKIQSAVQCMIFSVSSE